MQENPTLLQSNNKSTEQPAHMHMRSLINAFVVSSLESMTDKLATWEMSIF